ncbi:MAG: SIMPL domain-containing protein [Bacteriovoracia bacterium]
MLLALLLIASTQAATRTVNVQGRCEIKVTPDRASLELKMEKTLSDPAAAVNEVTKKIEAARAEIKKMNLAHLELRTTHFQVSPHREWENNKNVFKGHRASMGLEVITSDIAKLGGVMAMAAKQGLNGTDGFRPFLSLEKSRTEYLKCLDVASQDALKKAQQLAKSLDAKVGEVESISESAPVIHRPQPMYSAMMDGAAMEKSVAAPTIDVGEETFSTTLQVSFKLK